MPHVALLLSFALAQAKPAGPEVDPKAVNAAIDKGAQWLLSKHPNNRIAEQKYLELVLLTLVHAGVPPEHPIFTDNFPKLMGHNLNETYNVGLRALLLEKINRKAYQPALAEIGMYFVENQCDNGQWHYGGHARRVAPAPYQPIATGARKKAPSTGTQVMEDGPPPGKEIKLGTPVRSGRKTGDNSNLQYAILGLFSASRANVTIPKATWRDAERWLGQQQNADGGWGYNSAEVPGVGLVTTDASSGAMTTAALTGLIVSEFYQGKDWKDDKAVQRGIDWLAANFSVVTNPGGSPIWHYYFLYGLERVGTISGLHDFGAHAWYKEGAEYLIRTQAADGSWKGLNAGAALTDPVTDTCFAILFLKRATPPLEKPKDVATGVSKKDEDSGKPDMKRDDEKR